MSGWFWLGLSIWALGVTLTVLWHIGAAPNATLPLVALRAAVFPIFWVTGWPRGAPMPMD